MRWFIASFSSLALAEVADKEPNILQLWSVPFVIMVAALAFASWGPTLALLLVPASLLCALGQILELHDPLFGPAIRDELGGVYLAHTYLASFTAVAGPFVAWLAGTFHRRRTNS